MLTLFRTNQLFASILLLLYIALLRASAFVVPITTEVRGAGLFSQWVYDWIGVDGTVPGIVAMVLLLLQGFYLNVLVAEHRLASEITLFPGLFYVYACSFLPEFHYLSPLLLANTFYIIVLGEIYSTYKRIDCAGSIFNIGFWSAVGALFYPAYVFLLLFGFVSLNILRAFRTRERLMMVVGFIVPFFLLGTWYFWIDKLPFYLQYLQSGFQFIDFEAVHASWVYRSLGLSIVLLLIVLFSHRTYMLKQNIETQRKINIIFWGLLTSAFTLLYQADIQLDHLLILALPLGTLLSLNFVRMRPRLAEVIHLLMLAIALGLQYMPVLFP